MTCSSSWKKLYSGVFGWFWLIFGNLRPKNFRALLKMFKYGVRWSPLQFIWQNFSSIMNIFTVIIKILKKMVFFGRFWLIFGNLRPNYFRALLKMSKYAVRWSPLQFIWQYFSSIMNIFTVIIKMLKKMVFFGRFWPIFGNLRPKIFRALLKMLKYGVRRSLLQFIWQNFYSTMHIFTVIIEILKKMLKIADFANFGRKYLGPQSFPRHAVCGSKLEI